MSGVPLLSLVVCWRNLMLQSWFQFFLPDRLAMDMEHMRERKALASGRLQVHSSPSCLCHLTLSSSPILFIRVFANSMDGGMISPLEQTSTLITVPKSLSVPERTYSLQCVYFSSFFVYECG